MNREKDNDCFDCEHFIAIDEEGKCDIYGTPNHGERVCPDWKLSKMWVKMEKRGYI